MSRPWILSLSCLAAACGTAVVGGCSKPPVDRQPPAEATQPRPSATAVPAPLPTATGATAVASTVPVWPVLQPEGEGFRVELPGRPETQTNEVDTPSGKVFVRLYSLADQSSGRVYSVTVNQLPNPLKAGEVSRALELMRNGALERIGGKVVSETNVKFGDYSGLSLAVELDGGTFFHARLVVADDRLYSVGILSDNEALSPDDRRVFGSLEIGKSQISIAQPRLQWRIVTPQGSTFAVEMPDDPQEQVGLLNTPLGRVDLRRLEAKVNGRTYFAQSCDLPTTGGTIKERLDAAREHVIRESAGRLLDETDVTLDGSEGRAITVGLGDRTMWLRTFVDGPRVYQIGVVAAGAPADDDRRFFASFRLSERESGK